jgi:hypothetical protein
VCVCQACGRDLLWLSVHQARVVHAAAQLAVTVKSLSVLDGCWRDASTFEVVLANLCFVRLCPV